MQGLQIQKMCHQFIEQDGWASRPTCTPRTSLWILSCWSVLIKRPSAEKTSSVLPHVTTRCDGSSLPLMARRSYSMRSTIWVGGKAGQDSDAHRPSSNKAGKSYVRSTGRHPKARKPCSKQCEVGIALAPQFHAQASETGLLSSTHLEAAAPDLHVVLEHPDAVQRHGLATVDGQQHAGELRIATAAVHDCLNSRLACVAGQGFSFRQTKWGSQTKV